LDPAPTSVTAATLLALGAATLGESGGRPMRARVRAAWPGAAVAAPAFPVSCSPGDNLAVHVAVTAAPPGSVLVVDVGEVDELGYWGEVLTTAAEARGIVGLVIDGGVRDVAALAAHGFPVFSTTIALPGATKDRPGRVGDSARVGGVDVGLDDWVVADVDGVTVVPRDLLDAVLEAGRVRADKEAGMFDELRAGRTTVELLGLDPGPVQVASSDPATADPTINQEAP
jgi:4-hydroxy-4-methyl-2-oxoglutarate aldolase